MIDIVVANYHTPGDLLAFIRSTDQISVPFSLAVIDVHQAAEDEKVVEAVKGTMAVRSTYINHPMNIGYARAVNLGVSFGTFASIGIFNADVQILEGSVESCLETLVLSPDIGVVGPKQVDRAKRLTHAGIVRKGRAGCIPRAFHHTDRGQYDRVEDVVSVSGSAYFTKRDIWDELGGCPLYQEIDPKSTGAFLTTNHYYEETWYSYHAAAHGYRVVYDGTAKMIHLWHRASKQGGWAERQMRASEEFFGRACAHHGIAWRR